MKNVGTEEMSAQAHREALAKIGQILALDDAVRYVAIIDSKGEIVTSMGQARPPGGE